MEGIKVTWEMKAAKCFLPGDILLIQNILCTILSKYQPEGVEDFEGCIYNVVRRSSDPYLYEYTIVAFDPEMEYCIANGLSYS